MVPGGSARRLDSTPLNFLSSQSNSLKAAEVDQEVEFDAWRENLPLEILRGGEASFQGFSPEHSPERPLKI